MVARRLRGKMGRMAQEFHGGETIEGQDGRMAQEVQGRETAAERQVD